MMGLVVRILAVVIVGVVAMMLSLFYFKHQRKMLLLLVGWTVIMVSFVVNFTFWKHALVEPLHLQRNFDLEILWGFVLFAILNMMHARERNINNKKFVETIREVTFIEKKIRDLEGKT